MKFESQVIPSTLQTVYQITFNGEELAALNLDEMDRRLLKECEGSGLVSDKLLALEAIARNIEVREEKQ